MSSQKQVQLRPSMLPAIRECGQFRSGKPRSFTLDGTIRHEALESKWESDNQRIASHLAPLLDDRDIEGIEWAFDYMQIHAPLNDYPLRIEQAYAVYHPETGNEIMVGHLDYVCGDHIFDVKWRRRNYREQMAAYALAIMQARKSKLVTVHVLYMESHQSEVIQYAHDEAWDEVKRVINRAEDPQGDPTPCDYCGWCSRVLACKPYLESVQTLGEWVDPLEAAMDRSLVKDDPIHLARALHLYRRVKFWGEQLEEFALEQSMGGLDLPGFELTERKGRKFIPDIARAFNDLGLEQEAFLSACNISIPKLTEARRALDGSPLKDARRDVFKRLGDNIKQSQPTYNLKSLEK
tara:strand:+ start:4538 stop:5587 length:1050 start_codon:yes stop_codon:yes gene_type:complete